MKRESQSEYPISPSHRSLRERPVSPLSLDGSSRDLAIHESDSYARLLQYNSCYEAIPMSSKMVIFDSNLLMKKAFNGLIYQNTRHVLISRGDGSSRIEGILSVTDFIRMLLKIYNEKKQDDNGMEVDIDCNAIADMTIQQYRDSVEADGGILRLISLGSNRSLLDAARTLAQYHIHRLPVVNVDDGTPLYILTHKRILQFLWTFGSQFSLPEYYIKTPKALGVGTWENIKTITPDTPLHQCLKILCFEGISGVPVVEEGTQKMIGMYSRFDAIAIAMDNSPNCLDKTVSEALAFKNANQGYANPVVSINLTDTFWRAVEVLVERNVHRLCALNDRGQVEGVISLADVINHMVVKPGVHLRTPSTINLREPRTKRLEDMTNQELRQLLKENAETFAMETRK